MKFIATTCKILGYICLVAAGILALMSIIGIWMKHGFSGVLTLMSPFNVKYYITLAITFMPGIGLLILSDKLKNKIQEDGEHYPPYPKSFNSKYLPFLIFSILFHPAILQANELAVISKIIDGDTLKINYNSREVNVRLIGIDTPENKSNTKAKRDVHRGKQDIKTITAMGKEAMNFVKTLVKPGDEVTVEFDIQHQDRYGRLLGYIYLPNGKMLNEEIIRSGFASPMTIPPNVKYSDRFLNAYKIARENHKGLWKKE